MDKTLTILHQNLSFVLEGVKKVSYQDRPIPSIQDPHDVQVHVKFTGVCGSDVHYWQHGSIGSFILTSPMVLGHESSGTITSVGSAVTTLKPGDRVALEPGIPCRRCEPCRGGKYNLCLHMAFAATPPIDGTLAKYYVLPEDFCYKLPDHVGLEEGALMEPLAVAVHVTRQGRVGPGDKVVVFGAGPVGLLCCAVARAFGASVVIAVDIQPARLEFARGYAATGVYEPAKGVEASVNAERLREMHGLGRGADVVIDASGAEASVHTGIHVLRTGGTYVQGGMGRDVISFPIMAACTKELDVRGSFRYGSGDYKLAVGLVAEGRVDVKRLVTGTVGFREAERAITDVQGGKGIKTLIRGVED
ncbi:chlorophyll synthesis pathway protein BchC [Helicocarpus griseus UAMH5409]|uniref:D-xylulose reductase n=1 Tax=Helicocarpus griseus UAMH5409 TaxID=1447875 RepID=A0A2B7XMH6_9EURO|nr:chlorophyll synthesis pathway protein BchC [Helicocarpus griseus UAMH5409]